MDDANLPPIRRRLTHGRARYSDRLVTCGRTPADPQCPGALAVLHRRGFMHGSADPTVFQRLRARLRFHPDGLGTGRVARVPPTDLAGQQ